MIHYWHGLARKELLGSTPKQIITAGGKQPLGKTLENYICRTVTKTTLRVELASEDIRVELASEDI